MICKRGQCLVNSLQWTTLTYFMANVWIIFKRTSLICGCSYHGGIWLSYIPPCSYWVVGGNTHLHCSLFFVFSLESYALYVQIFLLLKVYGYSSFVKTSNISYLEVCFYTVFYFFLFLYINYAMDLGKNSQEESC